MEITTELLTSRLKAMRQEYSQRVADLQALEGAMQIVDSLIGELTSDAKVPDTTTKELKEQLGAESVESHEGPVPGE